MPTEVLHDGPWDLAIEIAAKLWINGEYVAEVDPLPTQRLVDLQWAAHQAGRVLGGRAKVKVTGTLGRDPRSVTVTVTYVDSNGLGLQRAQEGLESLMRLVLEVRAKG